MGKRITAISLLLALAVGLYAVAAHAKGERIKADPTQTAQATNTAKPDTCKVITGVDGGTVNLRECEGASCGAVLDIVTEGESLTILTAGLWVNVTNADGITGWLNSKYCKGK